MYNFQLGYQKTADSPFFEWRLLNLFFPLMESESVGCGFTKVALPVCEPSCLGSGPWFSVLAWLDKPEGRSRYESSVDDDGPICCAMAISRARSSTSNHSRDDNAVVPGIVDDDLGSSKTKCFSFYTGN